MLRWLILLTGLFFCAQAHAATNMTSFGQNVWAGWEHRSFVGENSYQESRYKERTALRALSEKSASGWTLKQRIDLLETPTMNWSWLTRSLLPAADETSRTGDDYVARIYVIIDGGIFVWRTLCLNYVWSSSQNKGQVWNSAVAGANVKMISVRGKEDRIETWYDEKRNIYEDLITFFGDRGSAEKNLKRYRYIDMIAIMTDTDNSGARAESYYGDIIFSLE